MAETTQTPTLYEQIDDLQYSPRLYKRATAEKNIVLFLRYHENRKTTDDKNYQTINDKFKNIIFQQTELTYKDYEPINQLEQYLLNLARIQSIGKMGVSGNRKEYKEGLTKLIKKIIKKDDSYKTLDRKGKKTLMNKATIYAHTAANIRNDSFNLYCRRAKLRTDFEKLVDTYNHFSQNYKLAIIKNIDFMPELKDKDVTKIKAENNLLMNLKGIKKIMTWDAMQFCLEVLNP